jgi:hypothetical protein
MPVVHVASAGTSWACTGLVVALLGAGAIGCATVAPRGPAPTARPAAPARTAEPGPQAAAITVPNQVDGFTRSPSLEQQLDVAALAAGVSKSSAGSASDVRSAVYEQGNLASSANAKIFMFVGGNLSHGAADASLVNFERSYPTAHAVSADSLPGDAACTATVANKETVSMCVWFDNDTFGTLVSPTMTTAQLATTMDQVRPSLERSSHVFGSPVGVHVSGPSDARAADANASPSTPTLFLTT